MTERVQRIVAEDGPGNGAWGGAGDVSRDEAGDGPGVCQGMG